MARITWISPVVVMVSSGLAGILLAIGHHLYYASLSDKEAPTGSYSVAGANVSKQQFNTAVGTAFSFLVKSALALAIAVAYIQAFWHAAKTSSKGQTLSAMDTMSSALENVWNLFKVQTWLRHPLLFGSALIAWLVPIASIVTPATLSVQIVMRTYYNETTVPQIDFANLALASPMIAPYAVVGNSNGLYYNTWRPQGPSYAMQRVASAVTAQGQILPIQAAAPNASWTLQFAGPSLSCEEASDAEKSTIWPNVQEYINQTAGHCQDSLGYISWITGNQSASILPFIDNGTDSFGLVNTITGSTLFMTVPNITEFHPILLAGCDGNHGRMSPFWTPEEVAADEAKRERQIQELEKESLTKCQVFNATYTANFSFVNGAQSVLLAVNRTTELIDDFGDISGPNATDSNPDCIPFNDSGQQAWDPGCNFDLSLLRRVSYQSVIAAFVEQLKGTIGFDAHLSVYSDMSAADTNVVKTALMNTDELSLFQIQAENASLNTVMRQLHKEALVNNATTTRLGPLPRALEDMFANLTISLMSEEQFQPNYSSPYAPNRLVNVTFTSPENVYAYDYQTLWTAYGLAIGFTLLVLGLGITSFLTNSATYDYSFSTVLRVGRLAELSDELVKSDGDGHYPLPNRLKNVRILMNERVRMEERKVADASSDTLLPSERL